MNKIESIKLLREQSAKRGARLPLRVAVAQVEAPVFEIVAYDINYNVLHRGEERSLNAAVKVGEALINGDDQIKYVDYNPKGYDRPHDNGID